MSGELEDNEVKINEKKFGKNTTIQMNLYTFVALIVFIFGIFFYFYRGLKSDFDSYKIIIENERTKEKNELKEILKGMKTDISNMDKSLQTFYTDLMIVIDRTSRNNTNNTNKGIIYTLPTQDSTLVVPPIN